MEIKGGTWRMLFLLLLGQLVSFSLAICNFITSVISDHGVDAPLTQSFFSYMLLALVYGPILLRRRQTLLIPWYWYLLLVLIDVAGNCLTIKAYQYSYITSITLLSCCTIPWVMILTRFALGARYSFWQFVGAGTSVAGLSVAILSDSDSPDVQDVSKIPLLGDAIAIAGTLCFAFSNVGEEYCVKKKDRIEYLAMLGIFGMLVTGIQLTLFERKKIDAVNWSPTMIGLFAGFAAVFLVFRTTAPFVIKMSGATLFNLSLLTTDVWAVAVRIFFYHQQVNWIYYISFSIVAIGLVIYSVNESSSDDDIVASTTEQATQYEQLSRE
ncbi:uncharacterized protein [Lolium perenne]|uniref:uncharacterized protein isoform X1 n=2 Tax=Lolium perenne TaxID=4522 RepID=UPI0021F50163|nr:uncharacterized protein LOC127323136 [Lolium perenne]